MMPNDPVVGGTVLRRPAIQSPNFQMSPLTGWSIDQDGSAFFGNATISGTVTAGTFEGNDFIINTSGLFFYAGTPAAGNLVASIAPAAGTDSFGNFYPGGEAIGLTGQGQIQLQPNINQAFDVTNAITGVFTAMAQYFTGDANQMMPSMLGSLLLGSGTATKMSSVMHSPFGTEGAVLLLEAQNDAGTDTPVITAGTVTMPDGVTMVYSPVMTLTPYAFILYSSGAGTQVVVTKTSGSGTISIPAGVSTAKAECWGAGGGGGGGFYNSSFGYNYGGGGGGGGEYAEEPSLAVGSSVSYSVGAAGSAGTAGNPGGNGGNSTITGTSVTVTANGGGGGGGGPGTGDGPGTGGTGSTNTVHFSGGTGGQGVNTTVQYGSGNFGNGGGGGGSAGISAAGNTGEIGLLTGGGNGGAAVSGGGAGGNGANSTFNGSAGSAPGGSGGGGGCNSTTGHAGGSGTHGQVRITYSTGAPAVGLSINFGSAFNDQFGTSIPAGTRLSTPAGLTGEPDITQTDAGTNTLGNSTTPAALSKTWTIPANDAQATTVYMIEVPFTGVHEGQVLNFGLLLNGSNHNICPVGGAWATTGHATVGTIRLYVQCVTTGSSGSVAAWTDGCIQDSTINRGLTPGLGVLAGAIGSVTFNTTVSNTISLSGFYTATATGQTTSGQGSIFTRKGP